MTSDSAACLRTFYATTDVLELPLGLGNEREEIRLAFRFFLCLTDDEAQRLTSQPGGDETEILRPSGLRCVDDKIGIDQLVDALAGDPAQTPEEAAQVLQSCGIDFLPLPSPGAEGTGAFNQVSLIWLQFDPALQGLIDCLREAASVEELDAFFSGASAAPPEGVPGCLEQYASLLPSGG